MILIDKEINWTSFDVVNKIRCSFKPRKIKVGHAGTLDPLATGLLIVCTGRMTKEIHKFQSENKTYIGTMTLGFTTPSFDLGTSVDKEYDFRGINEQMILNCTKDFVGEIHQVPPIYSALKVNGERLYKKARRGEAIEIAPRTVTIFKFEILEIDLPNIQFLVECSKGTYIRSLANDFAKALSSGGCLTQLRRIKIGDYSVEDSMTVNKVTEIVKSSLLF